MEERMKNSLTYGEKMKMATESGEVIFFDYYRYKVASGWRPDIDEASGPLLKPYPKNEIKASYKCNFVSDLPNVCMYGFPIKLLMNHKYTNGRCHASTVALSLCYDKFQIATANLSDYATDIYKKDFEHSFLIVPTDKYYTDGTQVMAVVDPAFGFYTTLDTYDKIFNLQNVRTMSSFQTRQTKPYSILFDNKDREIVGRTNMERSKLMDDVRVSCRDFESDDPYQKQFFTELMCNNDNYLAFTLSCENEQMGSEMKFVTEDLLSELKERRFDINIKQDHPLISSEKVFERGEHHFDLLQPQDLQQ